MAIKLTELQASLKQANATWEAAENNMTALSTQEANIRLGAKPGAGDKTLAQREAISTAALAPHLATLAVKTISAVPAAYDWRNVGGRNFITGVKDQGGCGSCVAFGTLVGVDGTVRTVTGIAVNDKNGNIISDLSEAQLFYCGGKAAGATCETGWWPTAALNYIVANGLDPESCFPYTAGDQACKVCANSADWLTRVHAYHIITNVTDMKAWLATRGPLTACFSVYDDFFSYKSGVYHHVSGPLDGGHCVGVVGYSDVLKAWLCKNSWGTGFGIGGYFWIAYGQCGIDSEMWAVDSFTNINLTPNL